MTVNSDDFLYIYILTSSLLKKNNYLIKMTSKKINNPNNYFYNTNPQIIKMTNSKS